MIFSRFIPESTRWLITKNRIVEAKRLIQIAAKTNKKDISDEKLTRLLTPLTAETEENVQETVKQKKISVLDIFRYPNLRKKALIIFFDW